MALQGQCERQVLQGQYLRLTLKITTKNWHYRGQYLRLALQGSAFENGITESVLKTDITGWYLRLALQDQYLRLALQGSALETDITG